MSEVKIIIKADGSGVRLVTDGVAQDFTKLGDAAAKASDKATEGFGATRRGVISISEQLKNASDRLDFYAKSAAAVFAADKLFAYSKEVALMAARYETLGVSMTVVGKNSGYTATQMEDAAKGMQAMGISMVESRQQAMRLVQAHIDLSQSQKLARIAQDAAVIGNMNSSEAFAHMIHGISTGQTEVLRTVGLNVSMEQSYKVMAQTLHKSTDSLTQNEKTQAIVNATLKAGADIAGTYEAAMDTAGKQLNSMKRYTDDLKTVQGEVFNEVLTTAVMGYTAHLKDANSETKALAANGELKTWGMELAQIFVAVANAVDNTMTAVKMVGNQMASRNVVGDITKEYQTKLDAMGNTPDLWKQRGELVAQRDAEIKSALALLDESNTELGQRADRFQRAFDERQKALADKSTKAIADTAQREQFLTQTMAFWQQQRANGLLKEADYVKGMSAFLIANYGDNHVFKDTAIAPTTGTDTRAKKLEEAITAVKTQFDREKEIYSEREKMLKTYHAQLGLEDADFYAGQEAARAEYLQALATEYSQEAALIASFKAKTPVEVEDKKSKLLKLTEEYEKHVHDVTKLVTEGAVEQSVKTKKQLEETTKAVVDSGYAEIAAQLHSIEAAKLHNAEIGKTPQQIALIKLAIAEKEAVQMEADASYLQGVVDRLSADKEWADENTKALGIYQERINILQKLAAGQREMAQLDKDGASKQTAVDVAKASAEEWKRGWEETERLGRDVFTNWDGDLEHLAGSFGQSLVKAGKSALFDLFAKPIALNVYTTIAGDDPAKSSGFSALGGVTGNIGNVGSIFGAGGLSGAVSGGAGWVTGATTLSGSLEAGASLMALDGGFAAGAAMIGGALLPVVAGLAVLSAVLGEKNFETKYGGNFAMQAGGSVTQTLGNGTGGNFANRAMEVGIETTVKTINDLLHKVGSQAAVAAFAAGAQSDKDKAEAYSFAGGSLSTGASFGQTYHGDNLGKASPEEVLKAFGADLNKATIAALQAATDIPKSISEKLAGVNVETLSADAVSQLASTVSTIITNVDSLQAALGQLPFESVQGLSFDAAAALIEFSGGLDALKNNLNGYYQNYFSVEEQRAQTIVNITRALTDAGVDLAAFGDMANAGRGALRAAMEDGANSGAQQQAALLAVQDAYAKITPDIQKATAATQQAASAQNDYARAAEQAASKIASERAGLQDQLDALTMTSAELLAKQRNALDESNRALFDQIQAQKDLKQAADDAAKAQADYAATLASRTTTQLGILAKIADVTGDKGMAASVLKQQRDTALADMIAKGEVGTALLTQRLWDYQDAAKVAADAAKGQADAQKDFEQLSKTALDAVNARGVAMGQEAADAKALADVNKSWQDRIDIATGTRLARDVALQNDLSKASDNSTRALIAQAYAAEDSATAIATATQSAKSAMDALKSTLDNLGSTRVNLQAQLLTAQGDVAGGLALKRQAELAALTKDKSAADTAAITAAYGINTDYEDKITAANEAKKAADAMAEAQKQAAEKAQAAAKALTDAWQQATNSVMDEVKRIRGLIIGNTPASLAAAQASFAIATAQARSGDQEAYKQLPTLSKAMLDVAMVQAKSLLELQTIQGQTAASLEATAMGAVSQYGLKLPSFDVGTNAVPRDMIAMVHKGEAIIPAPFNPYIGSAQRGASGGNDAALLQELQALRVEVSILRRETALAQRAIAGHAADTVSALDRQNAIGVPAWTG